MHATLFLTVVAVLLGSTRASAQGEPARCRAVADSLRSSGPTPSRLATLASCPITGGPALGAVWARDVGPEQLESLRAASARIHDRALYDALKRVVGTPTRASRDRLAALRVLLTYVDPSYAPSLEFLQGEGDGVIIPRTPHPPRVTRGAPLPESRAAELQALIFRVATTDADGSVRRAARRVRQAFALSDPHDTPLRAGAITLLPKCGSRVALETTADVDLSVQLRVLGTGFVHSYDMRAASTERPARRLLSLPAGTVVATFGGREVARLTTRQVPCAPGEPRIRQ